MKESADPGRVVSRRMQFVDIGQDGRATHAGWAPHLDLEPIGDDDLSRVREILDAPWVATGNANELEQRALAFSPDLVIVSHYRDNREMTQGFLLTLGSRGLMATDPEFERLLSGAGLRDMGTGGLPIPYAFARRAAERAGIQARMPYGEARSRALRIADPVLEHSFARFSEMMKRRGIAAAVLALNVVTDEVPPIPLRDEIEAIGLPILDLFDVYPPDRREAIRVAPWDDHPNAEGHQIIADGLYRELTTFIQSGAVERARSLQTANLIH